jgi:hypothetical protein
MPVLLASYGFFAAGVVVWYIFTEKCELMTDTRQLLCLLWRELNTARRWARHRWAWSSWYALYGHHHLERLVLFKYPSSSGLTSTRRRKTQIPSFLARHQFCLYHVGFTSWRHFGGSSMGEGRLGLVSQSHHPSPGGLG